MIIIPDEALDFLKKEIKNFSVDNYSTLNDLLDTVSDLILYAGFDENYELNEYGIKAENAYDDIYNANVDWQHKSWVAKSTN